MPSAGTLIINSNGNDATKNSAYFDEMGDDISLSDTKHKLPWYYAPAYLLLWLAFFWSMVLPAFHYVPDSLSIKDEPQNPGRFVAEYAQQILYKFDRIGPKVQGSNANENITVQLLMDEIGRIRNAMNTQLFDIEIDLQQASGAFICWETINTYQGVQNVVVKISSKSSNSDSYLLLNSHFDSKPATPSTGDDGFMVVVMLETLRQIAISDVTFEHPIIFLFNGAEEIALQGSHAFITQHKWAKQCRALLNLEAAGTGGREILFQGGPKHNWLMSYYNKHAKYPFATTLAEEIFQAGVLPSDTDFRIFRDYGNVPGLDMALVYNGYVYHTKFDSYDVIPRNTIQSSGDNVLSLVRAFSNAPELSETEKHVGEHAVFFDYLGLFFVYYTDTTGIVINCIVSVGSIAIMGYALWRIFAVSQITISEFSISFGLIFVIQLLGFLLAFGLPLLLAVILDAANHSMTWFTSIWLDIGLYICPSLIGLSLPLVLFFTYKPSTEIIQTYRLQMALHAYCFIMALICIILTAIGVRSVYVLMISIFFYTVSIIINQISCLYEKKYYWVILHTIIQIPSFLYGYYITYLFLVIITPMMGRNGSGLNPDLLVALACSFGTILSMGFLIPLVNIFRRSKLIVAAIAAVTVIFIIISVTPLGYPYRPRTNVQRVNFMQVERVFYEYDGSVSLNESGYLIDFQDRRRERPLFDSDVDLSRLQYITEDCEKYMLCGMPLYNYRWKEAVDWAGWIPRDIPVTVPGVAQLELLTKVINSDATSIRYEFKLTGTAHMSLFVQPLEGVTLTDWSFLAEALETDELTPPYHVFFVAGNDASPLSFYFNFESETSLDRPIFELGVSAHYVSFEHERDAESIKFIESFPDDVHLIEWPTSYKRYIF